MKNDEDHFAFQHLLYFLAGKKFVPRAPHQEGFMSLVTQLPETVRYDSACKWSWKGNLPWQANFDPQKHGHPLTSTMENTNGSEEVADSDGCSVRK